MRLPRPRRTAATAALVALVAGLTAVPGAAQDLGPHTGLTQAAARTGADRTQIVSRHQVTLITGDRVTLDTDSSGRQSVTVEPAKGREHLTFVKRQDGRDWVVIPADALPLLAPAASTRRCSTSRPWSRGSTPSGPACR